MLHLHRVLHLVALQKYTGYPHRVTSYLAPPGVTLGLPETDMRGDDGPTLSLPYFNLKNTL